jgi:phosphoglycerate dehydrogenase-like enzyme
MKKKAVFFGITDNAINRVYSSDILAKLESMVELNNVLIHNENLEEHSDLLRNVEVAFSTWGMPIFSEQEIKQYMPNLKAVFYAAGSVQRFARPFIDCGITVVSAWAANAVPVAEYTAAQIVLANKGFFQTKFGERISHKEAKSIFATFPGNYNTKVGILGAGMIGTKVIELLKPYKLEIMVFDPFMPDERALALGVVKADIKEIFAKCQTISNHLANLPQTVGILNYEHFKLMLPNATFINTGRGAQVVEKDLIYALKSVPTRTAVLDVTYPEPVESDSEFLRLENVYLTPHIAGSSGNELARMAEYMLEELTKFENEENLRYNVTLKMLETMA